ncbi:MAG TPA: potassium-transporting ATPase subunit KdpC [Burkholderiales bacterium]|nr:potassium-transporting ATPase subunit KdpC [Burkholderiales bacterium]
MFRELRPAIVSFSLLTLLTGIVYPLALTGLSQLLMPQNANGSLMLKNGKAIGSTLIGQSFGDPGNFWSRPSATAPMPYNGTASGGSNLGPTNPALIDAVKARVQALHAADPDNRAPIPVDLVTASGSGLDPDISPAAAAYQVARVAKARGMSIAAVRRLVAQYTQPRQFGVLGEARVNVLELNAALAVR